MVPGVPSRLLLEVFARGIRSRRQQKGWTQAVLAARSGLTQGEVSYLEAGQRLPTLVTLVALLTALECSLEALLGEP